MMIIIDIVLKDEVTQLSLSDLSHYLITFADVDKAVPKLKPGKRDGWLAYIGLTSDHIINAWKLE